MSVKCAFKGSRLTTHKYLICQSFSFTVSASFEVKIASTFNTFCRCDKESFYEGERGENSVNLEVIVEEILWKINLIHLETLKL